MSEKELIDKFEAIVASFDNSQRGSDLEQVEAVIDYLSKLDGWTVEARAMNTSGFSSSFHKTLKQAEDAVKEQLETARDVRDKLEELSTRQGEGNDVDR